MCCSVFITAWPSETMLGKTHRRCYLQKSDRSHGSHQIKQQNAPSGACLEYQTGHSNPYKTQICRNAGPHSSTTLWISCSFYFQVYSSTPVSWYPLHHYVHVSWSPGKSNPWEKGRSTLSCFQAEETGACTSFPGFAQNRHTRPGCPCLQTPCGQNAEFLFNTNGGPPIIEPRPRQSKIYARANFTSSSSVSRGSWGSTTRLDVLNSSQTQSSQQP